MVNIVTSFGLLFLTIAANFTAPLFSCDIQRLFNTNIVVKHFIGISLLLFFVILTNKDAYVKNKLENELIIPDILLDTLKVYIIFLITTRMESAYTLAILGLFILFMFLDLELPNKSSEIVARIEAAQLVMKYIMITIAAVGISKYYIKQRAEHSDKFNLLTFLVGTVKCRE
jgi:hypothetical protein